jgi:hypothetical protein
VTLSPAEAVSAFLAAASEVHMFRLAGISILISFTLPLLSYQDPPAKPDFSGVWQLDRSKTKAEVTQDVIWNINQQTANISIEESVGGKTQTTAKCAIGKQCEFEENGKKTSAMTYFLDKTLVQMRSAADNSSVIKRQLKLNEDGSLSAELITIVPSDKKEVLVFTRQKTAEAKR